MTVIINLEKARKCRKRVAILDSEYMKEKLGDQQQIMQEYRTQLEECRQTARLRNLAGFRRAYCAMYEAFRSSCPEAPESCCFPVYYYLKAEHAGDAAWFIKLLIECEQPNPLPAN